MRQPKNEAVANDKFIAALRDAGFNIGENWSDLTIRVGVNATSASWKEDSLPPAGDSPVPIQPVTPVSVEPELAEGRENVEQKAPKGKRTKAK